MRAVNGFLGLLNDIVILQGLIGVDKYCGGFWGVVVAVFWGLAGLLGAGRGGALAVVHSWNGLLRLLVAALHQPTILHQPKWLFGRGVERDELEGAGPPREPMTLNHSSCHDFLHAEHAHRPW